MPATYAKKRGRDDDEEEAKKTARVGGPLKRTGEQAEEWDQCVGPSITQLSPHKLPTKREALQRYRALRIQHQNASKQELAGKIAAEIITIWSASKVPSKDLLGCTKSVREVIDMWGKCHRKGGLGTPSFQQELDALLNVAPGIRGFSRDPVGYEAAQLENLRTQMRSRNNPSWERDFNFFLDQLKVINCFKYRCFIIFLDCFRHGLLYQFLHYILFKTSKAR